MRKLSLLLFFSLFLLQYSNAQQIPRGMKYQAVARDLKGNVLANSPVELRISLLSQADGKQEVHYTEVHTATTSAVGLFNLVIGEGKQESGLYDKVPWSQADIWMEIQIRTGGSPDFVSISNSRLLAVPYAYYAATAGELKSNPAENTAGRGLSNPNCPCEGGLSAIKVLYTGTSGVTVKAFRKSNLTELIATFNGVQTGAILTISAAAFNDGKLKKETFLQVLGGSNPVVEIPTDCETSGDDDDSHHQGFALGETFGNFSVLSQRDKRNNAECTVCDIRKEWHVGGNGLMDMCNLLGTKSYTDLVFITNNIERLRITKDGAISLKTNLEIGEDLTVKRNVFLNTNQQTGGAGSTINYGPFTVANNKATSLTGTLTTDGATHLKSTVTADGSTVINNSLTVSKNDPGFIASFVNSSSGEGDGIKIKLGKAKTIYSPPALPTMDPAKVNQLKDLIRCDYPGDRLNLLVTILGQDAIETVKIVAGLAVGAGNYIIDFINSQLGLPRTLLPATHLFGPSTAPQTVLTILDAIVLDAIPDENLDDMNIPSLDIPKIEFPKIPSINLSSIGVETIELNDLSFWGIPTNLCLTDAPGSTPLNNTNEFIRFTDKNDAKVGSIRGVSLSDWSGNYLNPIFLATLYGAITSSKIDKFHARYHFQTEIFKALTDYSKLGVEYASGNGDYAEWLERSDSKERISPGDIVAVVGGKITKDLENAEQVMVVSHQPIVLGNVPPEGKNYLGNNIAFMGQVPVKVMGPVRSGDYIVGQCHTPGYGIARHPEDMTIEDFKYAVGRSWDTKPGESPKLVNTVVGVHNGDYFKILRRFESKFNESEERLKNLESKVDVLIRNSPSPERKKPF